MVYLKKIIVPFLFTLLISLGAQAQIYNSEVVAKIDLEDTYNRLTITGTALNRTEINQSLCYDLIVLNRDKGSTNKSKNSQNGRFVLAPGQQKNLSVTSINKDEKERIIILLLIYNSEDALIGKDRIVINADENGDIEKIVLQKKTDTTSASLDQQYENADGLVLRGIVVEDTKTKLGSDFYKMFYLEYLQNNINGREIVTIKEVLAIGNNTKIEIYVGDNIVAEFIVRPQNDYLIEMRNQALVRVHRYLLDLERNGSQTKSY